MPPLPVELESKPRRSRSMDIPPTQTIYVNNLQEKIKKDALKRALYNVSGQPCVVAVWVSGVGVVSWTVRTLRWGGSGAQRTTGGVVWCGHRGRVVAGPRSEGRQPT